MHYYTFFDNAVINLGYMVCLFRECGHASDWLNDHAKGFEIPRGTLLAGSGFQGGFKHGAG